jgi:hypothetical protein
MNTPILILRYPKFVLEENYIFSNLTKDLQLEWKFLGSEEMGKECDREVPNQAV